MSGPFVTITPLEPGLAPVGAMLGDGVPQPTGYGGWEEVERPRREAFVDWRGAPLPGMSLPLVFEGYAVQANMQPLVDRLEALARPRGDDEPPTPVVITGPIPHSGEEWVIADIEWGDARRNDRGVLVRQAFTLQLLKHAEPKLLVRQGGLSRTGRTWVVREGDTLMSIAADRRVLGNARLWRRIARLNNIRDPRNLRVGQRLRLPPRRGR